MEQTSGYHSPCIVVHGGAWAIPDCWKSQSVEGVKQAAKAGHGVLVKVFLKGFPFGRSVLKFNTS